MSFLKNTKIKTKVLFVISLMSLMSLSGISYVSLQYKNTDNVYSDFIANEALAAVLNARTSGNLNALGMQMLRASLNDSTSSDFEAAVKTFKADRKQLEERQNKIMRLVPTGRMPLVISSRALPRLRKSAIRSSLSCRREKMLKLSRWRLTSFEK